MKQRYGKRIVTDWYDGPLMSMRVVGFEDGERLVEIETPLAKVSEPYTIGRDENVRDVTVRLDVDDLRNMMAMLNGEPVRDYRDEECVSNPYAGDAEVSDD